MIAGQHGIPELQPEPTHRVRRNCQHRRILLLRQAGPRDQLKDKTVESDEALVRSDPEIAVGRLSNPVDGATRESAIAFPPIVNVLLHRPRGIDRGHRRCAPHRDDRRNRDRRGGGANASARGGTRISQPRPRHCRKGASAIRDSKAGSCTPIRNREPVRPT